MFCGMRLGWFLRSNSGRISKGCRFRLRLDDVTPGNQPLSVDGMKTKDSLTPERRSWNMSRIRGKNTSPELIVRRLLHRMGYRFRLHVRIPVPASALSNIKLPISNRRAADQKPETKNSK